MLRFTAISTLTLFASSAFAETSIEKNIDVCLYPSDIAKSVMTRRQNGGSLPDLMKKIPTLGMTPVLEDMTKKLAIAAFQVPAYSNEKFQQAAITEFQNQTYLNCSKGVN